MLGSHEIGIPAGEHEATTASNKSGTDTEASDSVVEQSHDSADDGKQLHGDANQTQIENMAIAIPPRFDKNCGLVPKANGRDVRAIKQGALSSL